MKKMMTAIALAMGIVGFGLIAEEVAAPAAAAVEKVKTVAEMSVEELNAELVKVEAAVAAEKDEAKKAELLKKHEEIKAAIAAKAEVK
ncbi:MAG TPA: hypothetical protein PK821_05010 [Victivallales bacterium]|nr:hypothetical protein [Victivallales bacterium]